MFPISTAARTALASTLVFSATLASPAFAETTGGTTAAARSTPGVLPTIEETIVVSEVDLEPITLATKILDSDAYLRDGTKIGNVSDVVLDGDSRASAIIVGVGGFLGFDETYVAIPMAKVSFERQGRTLRVIADITKKELKEAEKAA